MGETLENRALEYECSGKDKQCLSVEVILLRLDRTGLKRNKKFCIMLN